MDVGLENCAQGHCVQVVHEVLASGHRDLGLNVDDVQGDAIIQLN